MRSEGGLRIVWDPALDHGAWPGPLADRSASAGELWLGPLGLLARLETELGLVRIHATGIERAGLLAASLADRTGWWRASYEADALGTSQRLLRDRDELRLWGWAGEPASARLAELWAAGERAAPGLVDRLLQVIAALTPERALDLSELELRTPARALAPLWQHLFRALGSAGVRVRESALPPVTSSGDLGRARAGAFTPAGDGSLVLLRPHGPLAGADELAAALAARPSLDGVLVVGADHLLDAAFARHGLPCMGAPTRPAASTALIRLVIEAAFEPVDPADLHSLLTLAPGPIPRRIATRLIDALGRFPGRRTPEWSAALAEGLALLDDDARPAIAERIATLLLPAARLDAAIPIAELDRRFAALQTWATRRGATAPSLIAVAALAAQLRALLPRFGVPALSNVMLRRLCDDVEGELGSRGPAHVGANVIADPGAMLAPARVVIWWGFTRDSAPSVARVRLSVAECAELRRLGVSPPDPGRLMETHAAGWRRPLDQARETLVLVCPRASQSGDESTPHPLWDELRARMPHPQDAATLEATHLAAPWAPARRIAAPRARPTAAVTVRTGRSLALRERESPSSLEKLVGCSLAWALHYYGRLREGVASGPATPGPLLLGTVAHHFMAEVFGGGALDERAAQAAAQQLVDRDLPILVETLALPRYQAELSALRQAIVRSARGLARLMAESGATVRGAEIECAGTHGGIALAGKADLVLDHPPAVIDLKWGLTSHRGKLEDGTALQLAAYAELFRRPGEPAPEVAYYSLTKQELLTPPSPSLPGARVSGDITPRETWAAACTALASLRTDLAAGLLHAPAADGTEIEAGIVDDRLVLTPACHYCSFGGLCGRSGCT